MLKLKPIYLEKIWGGNKIASVTGNFHLSNPIGEMLTASAISSHDCLIENHHLTLSQIWSNHPEWFNNHPEKQFPLLIKIIEAKADLSIQVHPNDEYAKIHENNQKGKSECWFILETENEPQKIVLGHNASSGDHLKLLVDKKKWEELLTIQEIKKNDVIDLQPGILHAIKAGTLLYELQQASDITYRVYDYDRLENNQLRPLHIKQALDVITSPQKVNIKSHKNFKKDKLNLLVKNKYFQLNYLKTSVNKTFNFSKFDFAVITNIDEPVIINNHTLKKYESVVVLFQELAQVKVESEAHVLIAFPH